MESIKRHYPGAVQMDTLRINYYYDTPDEALQKDNIILCVRQKEQQLVGEMKWHHVCSDDADGALMRTEYPFFCEQLPQKIIPYEGKGAVLQGTLVTRRSSFLIIPGIKMNFDSNYYLGICDYEIEIEFDRDKDGAAADLAKRFGLTISGRESKSTRFFEAKKMLNLCMQIGVR